MRKTIYIFIKRAILIWTSACFFALGTVGVLFPIFPGFIFLFLGLALLFRGLNMEKERKNTKVILCNLIRKLKIDNAVCRKLISFL